MTLGEIENALAFGRAPSILWISTYTHNNRCMSACIFEVSRENKFVFFESSVYIFRKPTKTKCSPISVCRRLSLKERQSSLSHIFNDNRMPSQIIILRNDRTYCSLDLAWRNLGKTENWLEKKRSPIRGQAIDITWRARHLLTILDTEKFHQPSSSSHFSVLTMNHGSGVNQMKLSIFLWCCLISTFPN